MKKKTAALALIVCLLCVPILASCGDGIAKTKKLKLDDYAYSIADAAESGMVQISRHELSALTKLDIDGMQDLRSDSEVKIVTQAGKTGAYNAKTGKFIVAPTENTSVRNDFYVSGAYHAVITEKYGADTKTTVYANDGTALLPENIYDSVSVSASADKFYNGEKIAGQIEFLSSGASAAGIIYLIFDDNGYLKTVSAADLTSEPAVGDTVNRRREYLLNDFTGFNGVYEKDDAFLKDYSLSYEQTESGGVKYYFRKGDKTTTLTLPSYRSNVLYINGKVFYNLRKALPYEQEKDYDFVTTDSDDFTQTTKYEDKYYAFDIAKGKTKQIKLNYSILSARPLYNQNKGVYDALSVTAVVKKDGIATFGNSADTRSYIIDRDGKVGFDFSSFSTAAPTFVKLTDDRYLTAAHIINGKGETVAEIRGVTAISEENGLIILKNADNKYGAADFDGKLVLPFNYGSMDFYGNKFYAAVQTLALSENRLVSLDKPAGLTLEEALTGLAADEHIGSVYSGAGLIQTMRNFTDGNVNGVKYAFYNYSGKKLIEVSGTSGSCDLEIYDGFGSNVITELGYYNASGNYVTEYYSSVQSN